MIPSITPRSPENGTLVEREQRSAAPARDGLILQWAWSAGTGKAFGGRAGGSGEISRWCSATEPPESSPHRRAPRRVRGNRAGDLWRTLRGAGPLTVVPVVPARRASLHHRLISSEPPALLQATARAASWRTTPAPSPPANFPRASSSPPCYGNSALVASRCRQPWTGLLRNESLFNALWYKLSGASQ